MIDADTLRGWCQILRDAREELTEYAIGLRARGRRVPAEIKEAKNLTIILLGKIESHLPEVQAVYVPAALRDAGVGQ